MQFLAAYIMKGRLQAMTVASTLALVSLLFPPVSIVSSAAVALVTLRRGGKEGLFVLICSCLAAALLSTLLLGSYQIAIIYGLVLWVPVWLAAITLREGRHLVATIEIAVLLGVVIVLGFYWYQAEPVQIWRGLLSMMIQQMIETQPEMPIDLVQKSAETFAHYVTGFIAAGSLYGMLLGLLLARWWQSRLFNPGGFRLEFLALKGHTQVAILTVLLLGVAYFFSGVISELCWNELLILLVFYSFIGTAVLHCIFSAMKNSRFMVPFLYVTLLVLPHVMVPIIALCGLSDAWLNLRNKLKPNGTKIP